MGGLLLAEKLWSLDEPLFRVSSAGAIQVTRIICALRSRVHSV